jgi:hypothetical protein
MNSSPSSSRALLGALVCAAVWFVSPLAQAQAVFEVQVNTSSLIGHAASPFYLDFQLNDGSGLGNGNNTVTLSMFNFHGGAAVGSAMVIGGGSGDLLSTISLTDTSFFNDVAQEFTPGALLSFRVSLTTNVDVPTPDAFVFGILDANFFNIPTFAASDALAMITITGLNPLVETYAANPAILPSAGGPGIGFAAPSVLPVPEPSTYGLIGAFTLVGIALWRRRISRVAT